MSFTSLQLACCGVRELEGLSAYSKRIPKLLYDFEQLYYKPNKESIDGNCRFRYLIFTCINDKTYGAELQDFILTNGLGAITKTDKNHNPNSGNLVQVFIWTVDHGAVINWLNKNPNPNKKKDTNNGQRIESQAAAGAAPTARCGDPNCLTCYGQRVVQQAQGFNTSSTSGPNSAATIGGNNPAGQQQR